MILERVGMIIDDWDFLSDEFLDIREIFFFLCITKGDSNSLRTGSTCSTDSMNV
jgi:hypothetical protein